MGHTHNASANARETVYELSRAARFSQADFLLVKINHAKSTHTAVSSGLEGGTGNPAYHPTH